MEEHKAVAYYDELTRKGEGAARFKRGLGFSSNDDQNDAVPQRGSALVSSSTSFLSSFVRASSPNTASKLEKESQLQSIQNKLKKKPEKDTRRSREDEIDRDKNRHSRRRSRSRSRDRRKRRSRSRSRSPRRDRRRSLSPRESRRSDREKWRKEKTDYSRLIEGYDKMSQAERVKAKMKFQLAETAKKDPVKGAGWERFEFDKDAPLDDDEEIEVGGDDDAVNKQIGQSFRYSTIEARRKEQIKTAHDEAIFGSSSSTTSLAVNFDSGREVENIKKSGNDDDGLGTNLLSEKVLAKQPGSWRDRVRKG